MLARAAPTGLRKRLIVLVLASVLPFLILIGFVARTHLVQQEPLAAERALTLARHVADQLDDRLNSIESMMRVVAHSMSADPRRKAENDRHLRDIAASLPAGFAFWRLFAPDGELVGSSIPDAEGPQRDYFRSLAVANGAGKDLFVTEPVNTAWAGYVIHMVLPMQDQSGARAQLVAVVQLRTFRALLDASELPEGSSVALVSERGIMLGLSPDPGGQTGRDVSSLPHVRASFSEQSGTTQATGSDSVDRLLAFARTRSAPWRVWTAIPMSAVFAESRFGLARALGYGGLALLLALLLASRQASQIIDPLTRLSTDAAKLGTGNLSHRSGVTGPDELGVLATTINEMASTLEQRGAALRESEERYKGMFDINPLPMWVFDPETLSFLAVNRSAIEIYGYSEAEFLAMKVSDIRPAEDVPEFVAYLHETGEKTRKNKRRHKRKDGTIIHAEIDSGVITFDERPARLVVAHDVSERVRAEEALREAEVQLRQSQRMEAIGQLTGGIAHDFNNVLTAIGSYSDFVYDSLEPGDARRLDIQEIRKAADRAAALTKQLLAFSRSQILQPQVLNVNAALAELEGLLKRLLSADLTLVLACSPDAGHVRADPGQITQVLINLAVNASDAMSPGGTLTIATRNERIEESSGTTSGPVVVAPGDYVVIEVSDTGSGIKPDTIQRIFDPFFTTKELGKGTGLGLSTVYGIVRQSGGYVIVESTVGVGSTFSIYLPLIDQPVEPERARAEPAIAGRRSEVILVVEDEDAVRRAAKRILEKKGYTVLEARDGNEAMKIIGSHPRIDLLLTDLVMPGMGGRELVIALKEQNRSIATLYMSGYTKDAVMRSELDPDIMVLEKPFSHAELATKVREVLDRAVTSD